mmetsp:Transcript_826/g.2834  ORF Transcript_826/g.2834 Transcript_826/m.2834 type:complete len:111 (-) Transcript_826:119-451(-)
MGESLRSLGEENIGLSCIPHARADDCEHTHGTNNANTQITNLRPPQSCDTVSSQLALLHMNDAPFQNLLDQGNWICGQCESSDVVYWRGGSEWVSEDSTRATMWNVQECA